MSETGKVKRIDPSRILKLPVSKKIELAQVAEREVRAVLITDSDREVQEAVLSCPRITEVEIVAIAKLHELDDGVLPRIAANVQWLKNYQVRRALVNNPRTPLPIALKLVPTLLDADLKQLVKNPEASEDLIVAAERTAAERGTDRRAPVKQQTPKDDKKAKSRLQERLQADGYDAPRYQLVGTSGPPHDRTFTASVEVPVSPDGNGPASVRGEGVGRSKKLAEQAAAQAALDELEDR